MSTYKASLKERGSTPSIKERGSMASTLSKEQLADPEVEEQGFGFNAYFFMAFPAASMSCIIIIMVFSSMGFGDDTYKVLSDAWGAAVGLGFAACLIMLVLYLLDVFWPPHLPGEYIALHSGDTKIGRSLVAFAGFLVLWAGICTAKTYPANPILVTVLLGPILVTALGVIARPETKLPELQDAKGYVKLSKLSQHKVEMIQVFKAEERDTRLFYAAAMVAFIISGFLCLLVWLCWMVNNEPGYEDGYDGPESAAHEQAAYVRWASPLVAAISNIVFGIMLMLRLRLTDVYDDSDQLKKLVRGMKPASSKDQRRESKVRERISKVINFDELRSLPEADQEELGKEICCSMKQMSNVVKTVVAAFACVICAVWVATQLVAANSSIANMALCLLILFMFGFLGLFLFSFRRLLSRMQTELLSFPLTKMMLNVSRNKWAHALAFCCFAPFVPIALLISMLNQLVRNRRKLYDKFPKSKKSVRGSDSPGSVSGSDDSDVIRVAANPEERWLTERVQAKVDAFWVTDWLDLCSRIYVCAAAFICWTIVPRAMNVFLAWLIDLLSQLNFWIIVFATFLVGMLCFLLPPVPGLTVYVFAGTILPATCPMGFWAGSFICMIIGWVLKLSACAMQQKLIGEQLGNSLYIRQLCGVHKSSIRAIEKVMSEPGLNINKCAVLCGGPDWPVSVMAGVLRCSLFQCELGTVPIITVIAPSVLVGAFYLRATESAMWGRANAMMLACATGTNMVWSLLCVIAIQNRIDKDYLELMKPLIKYQDLDWLDYKDARMNGAMTIRASDVPKCIKFVYYLGAGVLVMIGQLFFFATTTFFGVFTVTSDPNTITFEGSNALVTPAGFAAMGISCVAWLGNTIYKKWAARRSAPARAEIQSMLEGEEKETWEDEQKRMCEEVIPIQEQDKLNEVIERYAQLRQARIQGGLQGSPKTALETE